MGPEKGHEDDDGAEAPLLCGRAERDRVVQPGYKEPLGRPYCGLLVLKGSLKENWRGTF